MRRFAPTPRLAPYLFALCAGSRQGTVVWTTVDEDQLVPLTIWTPASSEELRDIDTLIELVRRPLRYYCRALGVRYPYPKCDLVFVPELPSLAFSPPGLATPRDRLLQRASEPGLYLPCVFAHELAHAWFGGLVDMRYDQDGWLQEALATYVSRTALEETQPGSTPWWAAISTSLPDHAYAGDAALLRQLEEMIGRQAVISGLGALLRDHRHGTITIDELAQSWSQTSGRDLRAWAAETLTPAPDPGAE
jgi:aminopeptidase N